MVPSSHGHKNKIVDTGEVVEILSIDGILKSRESAGSVSPCDCGTRHGCHRERKKGQIPFTVVNATLQRREKHVAKPRRVLTAWYTTADEGWQLRTRHPALSLFLPYSAPLIRVLCPPPTPTLHPATPITITFSDLDETQGSAGSRFFFNVALNDASLQRLSFRHANCRSTDNQV